MAEGGVNPSHFPMRKAKIQQLCRYYMHGVCNKGESCQFLHDKSTGVPSSMVCKYYQLGRCTYGSKCRYDHVKQSKPPGRDGPSTQSSRRPLTETNRSIGTMVTLRKGGFEQSMKDAEDKKNQERHEQEWVRAATFVPGKKFHGLQPGYAGAAKVMTETECENSEAKLEEPACEKDEDLLCPYYAHGSCPYGDACSYAHGDICDMCGLPRLHPTDEKQREIHMKECLLEHEEDMKLSFAVKESQEKECCICYELVMSSTENAAKDMKFGILENCTHCFCLPCIRRWRLDKNKDFGKAVRQCPICRVHSDFVTPSKYWVEEESEKKKLIQDYKDALRLKPCQYFKQGKGDCPFNEKCFYRHAYPDGTLAPPKPRKKIRRRTNADGETAAAEEYSLWDFLERREEDGGLISLDDELSLILLGLLRDSDDSDDENMLNNYSAQLNLLNGDFVFTDSDLSDFSDDDL